ncbi:MAG: hypothetical protein AB7O65_11790 [Candidatus Korobacteraceae bacterium]
MRTSADSPDTLPLRGYSMDQLVQYILRKLGQPVWNVEVTNQQVIDCIQDALQLFSEWVPMRKAQSVQLTRGRFNYLDGVDVGQGVAQVSFVEPNPVPTEIFYGNLINPAPLFRTGLDEYDTFLRWRKTWQRVTSIQPDWFYDEVERVLYIHNPIERYLCGVICYFPYDRTQDLTPIGSRWVKEYALASARYMQGDLWMKFSGAIPGPVKDLQLDATKRDKAAEEMEKLKEQLKGMQTQAGIFID